MIGNKEKGGKRGEEKKRDESTKGYGGGGDEWEYGRPKKNHDKKSKNGLGQV